MNLLDETEPAIIYGDSLPSQNLCKDWMVTPRSKHFDVKLRYLNEQVDNGLITFVHISGKVNPADCLTKVVSNPKQIYVNNWVTFLICKQQYTRNKYLNKQNYSTGMTEASN